MLTRLPQWTGSSSLRPIGRYEGADAKPEAEEWRPSPESWVGGESESGDDADMRRPGERLRVHRLGTAEAYTLGEVVITSPSLSREAGALAYMSAGPYDVRPHLLLAMFAQDERAIEACIGYGARYVLAWCNAHGVTRGEAAARAAAADAFGRFYFRRERKGKEWPLRERAKSLCMAPADYGELRRVALNAYRTRYLEALVAFGKQQRSEIDSTHESSYSGTGKDDRSPAHLPRALSRDTGQQLFDWAA